VTLSINRGPMGCEGGSLPSRRDLVRTKAGHHPDEELEELRLSRYWNCPLSSTPLCVPLALIKMPPHDGALCNYPALIEAMLQGYARRLKKGRDYVIASAVIKDHVVCPISGKEMNGIIPFSGCWPCGCVLSAESARHLECTSCPLCGQLLTDRLQISQNVASILS
jgi:hypothetical protein